MSTERFGFIKHLYYCPLSGYGTALDGGRFILLNSSLQELADAAALAGAAQLDGAQDSITRADTAAQATANNNPPRWYCVGGNDYHILQCIEQRRNHNRSEELPITIGVTTASSQTAPLFLSAVSLVTKSAVSNMPPPRRRWRRERFR